MVFEEFGALLSKICVHSPLAQNRPLFWTIIANPKAGGFTIKSRWKKHRAMLTECVQKAGHNPFRETAAPSQTSLHKGLSTGSLGLIPTMSQGHAAELCRALFEEAAVTAAGLAPGKPRPFYLLITAGGDGTSLETMSALYHAPEEIRRDFVILRLPMGTGNDGADAWELDKALDLIIEPSLIVRQRAIRLSTASGKGPFLAFNILSVGLDAFVTHMTNIMKDKMPGDSYKLWVDMAALFYDLIYKVGYMDLRSMDEEGKEVNAFKEKVLLLAVGESGRRTYGSHKWVLPDERNVCAMRQMSVFRKIALKGHFAYGTHINEPEAMIWKARTVEFSPQFPLLAQMDGETVLLKEGDFPATIELTEPVIQILKSSG